MMRAMATAEKTLQYRPLAAPRAGNVSDTDINRRVLIMVGGFRLLIALALLSAALLPVTPPILGARYPEVFMGVAYAYVITAIFIAILIRRGWSSRSVAAIQLATDITAITLAVHTSGGIGSGSAALLVMFVAVSGLSLPGKGPYFAAALAALALLLEQSLSFLQGVTQAADFLPAGVLGAIMLILALATQPLVRRIEETEALARQRGIDLENLAQLNDYVLQNLRESVVVVDPEKRIRLINQSAADHLGAPNRMPGAQLDDISPALTALLDDWRRDGPDWGLDVPNFLAADGSTVINAHIAPLGSLADGSVMIFLEDASLLAEKVQQSKLAALGRLSASIAHEIRNPLGALSHAGQLLAESPGIGAQEQRFLDIIDTNSKRVSEIVENVLQLSRRNPVHSETLYLGEWTANFVNEFVSTLELFEGQLSVLESADDVSVRMDPGHLHQVAWNLCENALKYASEAAGGIAVEMRYGRLPQSHRPYLEILDHGSGIPEELQDSLFEPFATGRNGGHGLGLFICRELCESNGATLRYEPGETHGSVFRIVFADPNRWEVDR